MRAFIQLLLASVVALALSSAFAQPIDHQIVCTTIVDEIPVEATIGVAMLVDGLGSADATTPT